MKHHIKTLKEANKNFKGIRIINPWSIYQYHLQDSKILEKQNSSNSCPQIKHVHACKKVAGIHYSIMEKILDDSWIKLLNFPAAGITTLYHILQMSIIAQSI